MNDAFLDRSFPAVAINGPGMASLTRLQMPTIGPDDVVVKVAYVGVCRTDLEIYAGSLGYFASGLGTYPIVPGHEMSGTVAAIGPSVRGLSISERVVVECIQSCHHCSECLHGNWIACADRKELGVLRANGAYARYVVVPSRFVHRLPGNLDLARAALCEPLAVCVKGLDRLARAWSGNGRPRRCAVIGAGPIGRMCALLLAQRGHAVTAFDRDVQRLADLPSLGIAASPRLDALRQFDALVEATGDPLALDQALLASRAGATILLLGFPYGSRPFNFENIVAYDRVVVGSVGSSRADVRKAIDLLRDLPLDAYMRTVLPLDRFADAWNRRRPHGCPTPRLKVD